MTKVLYPGSFDPITKGHMNIIDEASSLFREVVVAVLNNSSKKNNMFTIPERVEMIKNLYKEIPNVKVISGNKAAVDVAIDNDCKAIIRGLRGISDYDYELQLSEINKDISNGKIKTICLFADSKYQFISSSVVKEVFFLGKDISKYVPLDVEEKMKEKNNKVGEWNDKK